jgi:hypothetical protein
MPPYTPFMGRPLTVVCNHTVLSLNGPMSITFNDLNHKQIDSMVVG